MAGGPVSILLLMASVANAEEEVAVPDPSPTEGTFSINWTRCDAEPDPPGAPHAAGLAHAASWDIEDGGWQIDGMALPIVAQSQVLSFMGMRPGPDGQPWLVGGQVKVSIDGISLGEGMGGPGAPAQPLVRKGDILRSPAR
jgi:hypothetical protein